MTHVDYGGHFCECSEYWCNQYHQAVKERDAARALADELAEALRAVERQWYIGSSWPMETVRVALRKWEASRDDAPDFTGTEDPGDEPGPWNGVR